MRTAASLLICFILVGCGTNYMNKKIGGLESKTIIVVPVGKNIKIKSTAGLGEVLGLVGLLAEKTVLKSSQDKKTESYDPITKDVGHLQVFAARYISEELENCFKNVIFVDKPLGENLSWSEWVNSKVSIVPDSLILPNTDLIVEVRIGAIQLIKTAEQYKYRIFPSVHISDAKNKKLISAPLVWGGKNWGPGMVDSGSKEDLANHLKTSLEKELKKLAEKVCSL